MREKPAQTQAESPTDLHQYWSEHISRWKGTNLRAIREAGAGEAEASED